MSAAQTDVDNTAFENVDFATEDEKTTGAPTGWNATNDNFDITEDGVYFISASLQCVVGSGPEFVVFRIAKNGSTNLTHNEARSDHGYGFQWFHSSSSDELPNYIAVIAELSNGDTIDIQVKGSAATGIDIDGGSASILQLSTISAGGPTRRVMVIS